MTFEQRDKIAESNKRRRSHLCQNCGGFVTVQDGSKIGGMEGIQYRVCGSCGWTRAITHRPRREKIA